MRSASRMSAITERGACADAATMLHRLGSPAGASANPVTSAPKPSSHRLIQAPLKPVCPVNSTRRPRQNCAMVCVSVIGAPLVPIFEPVRFQIVQVRADAPKSQRAAEPDLKIQEFSQPSNQQEHVLVLCAALRGVGDFQRIAH